MDNVDCKNVYITKDEDERKKEFNNIWIKIVNLILKN